MEEKIYQCECGKTFTNPQSFNGHKSSCKTHHLKKYGTLSVMQDRIKRTTEHTTETARKIAQKRKEQKLKQWISEQHTCEKCGKVMTEKFGSGRFCSRQCANSRIKDNEQKKKVSKTFEKKYYDNPKYCSVCGKIIPFMRQKRSMTCSDECSRSNTQITDSSSIRPKQEYYFKIYEENPSYCSVCGKKLPYEYRKWKTCSPKCRYKRCQVGGTRSAAVQSETRRSKNEILFCNMCEDYFGSDDVLHNKPIFDDWDADVIILSKRIAILWNGVWHYKQISKRQSLEQVQSRDQIKIEVIKKNKYTPYVIKDLGSYNEEFVKQKFNEFILYLNNNTQ